MLNIKDIKSYYPNNLQAYERFILREYLQYKILEILFNSEFSNKLSFLGGTCLRIVHNNTRFSENLDFDNFNLTKDDFASITDTIHKELGQLGYLVEMRNVHKGAYHCYIRFPELLYNEGLTNHREEKILIQLDTEPHNFAYKPDQPILNKFDVFTQINATPKNLLLSQKFYAVLNRKRNKGRDFFDIVFLLGQNITPNYSYLHYKTGIENPEELKAQIIEKCNTINMEDMAKDVEPFLFHIKDTKKITLFTSYLEQIEL
ncbi:nucleotidyl transferase AbiEii/AbiGii toxin family protein [Algibacter sp. 2305UL17-15]|uniref:nucleotidyl transferase AbiEii/AbiGii toxin family protein n=1 Tax=Algibacter sp. 2305UL17-15 TaxID=3231268 RepID=UPI003459793B